MLAIIVIVIVEIKVHVKKKEDNPFGPGDRAEGSPGSPPWPSRIALGFDRRGL
jgi:hypothetical protein